MGKMVKNSIKDTQRATVFIVLALFLTLFVMVNAQQWILAAVIYIVIAGVSLLLYSQWKNIGVPSEPRGIDHNWIQDAFVGILLGIGVIVLGKFIPGVGVIGIPNVQSIAGTFGRAIILLVAAPIFETVLIQGFGLSFFYEKLRLNFMTSNIFQAFIFSIFHFTAYSGSLTGSSGSFITAGIMALIFGFLVKYQNSLIGAISMHFVLNLYIAYIKLNVLFF